MFTFRKAHQQQNTAKISLAAPSSTSAPTTRVLNIFRHHQHYQHNPLQLKEAGDDGIENRDDDIYDDSSVDMSLYTTQSKPSVRYNLGRTNSDYSDMLSLAPTEFTTEKQILQYKSEALLLDDESEEEDGSVSPYDYHEVIRLGRAPEPDDPNRISPQRSSTKSNSSKNEHQSAAGEEEKSDGRHHRVSMRIVGPVDLDESIADTTTTSFSRPSTKNSKKGPYYYTSREEEEKLDNGRHHHHQQQHYRRDNSKYTGPVDLDDTVADTSTCCSSLNGDDFISSPQQIFLSPRNGSAKDNSPSSSFEGLLEFATQTSAAAATPDREEVTKSTPPTAIISPSIGDNGSDDDDDDGSPYVWTDKEDASEEEDDQQPLRTRRDDELDELDELVNRSFAQTMDSISTSLHSPNVSYDWKRDSSGSLRLTEGELEKHMERSQKTSPIPPSSIDGYDNWKRQQENKRLYFLKLQKRLERTRNANNNGNQPSPSSQPQIVTPPVRSSMVRRSTPTRPSHHQHFREIKSNLWPNVTMMDSTRSPMERSIDSSIPTLDAGNTKPRRKMDLSRCSPERQRRRWTLCPPLPRFHNRKKKSNQKPYLPKRHQINGTGSTARLLNEEDGRGSNNDDKVVVPLSNFMQISSDEPSEVAEFSLAPLLTMDQTTLGSTVPGGETFAATNSHCLEVNEYEGSPSKLAVQYLAMERFKQAQAEREKAAEAKAEEERLSNRKELELERQREMNLQGRDRPPLVPTPAGTCSSPYRPPSSPYSHHHHGSKDKKHATSAIKEKLSKGSTHTDHDDDPKNLSICLSVDSSMVDSSLQSRSGSASTIIGPCVICNEKDREYIALPCFHYSYCSDCVDNLIKDSQQAKTGIGGKGPSCAICRAENVTFSRVYTD